MAALVALPRMKAMRRPSGEKTGPKSVSQSGLGGVVRRRFSALRRSPPARAQTVLSPTACLRLRSTSRQDSTRASSTCVNYRERTTPLGVPLRPGQASQRRRTHDRGCGERTQSAARPATTTGFRHVLAPSSGGQAHPFRRASRTRRGCPPGVHPRRRQPGSRRATGWARFHCRGRQ